MCFEFEVSRTSQTLFVTLRGEKKGRSRVCFHSLFSQLGNKTTTEIVRFDTICRGAKKKSTENYFTNGIIKVDGKTFLQV